MFKYSSGYLFLAKKNITLDIKTDINKYLIFILIHFVWNIDWFKGKVVHLAEPHVFNKDEYPLIQNYLRDVGEI
jgi:hypothetical protein